MKRVCLAMVLVLLAAASLSCSSGGNAGQGGSSSSPAGTYTGTIVMNNLNEAFIASYESPVDKSHPGANAEIQAVKLELIKHEDKMTVDGYKPMLNQSEHLTLDIMNNKNSKATIDGDYVAATLCAFLPSGYTYWGMYKDGRNGKMTVNIDQSAIHLANQVTDDKTQTIYTYTLDGTISGKKIAGTWSQQWDGTEVLSGTFAVEELEGVQMQDL